ADFPEGVIEPGRAADILKDFLEDPNEPFGFDHRRAHRQASELVEIGEDALGLLVRRSHDEIAFFHSSFREFLAALHLSSRGLAEQLGVVAARCHDPQWREVILSLLSLTRRPEDVQRFIDVMKSQEANTVETQTLSTLLAEIAFGEFNCPP